MDTERNQEIWISIIQETKNSLGMGKKQPNELSFKEFCQIAKLGKSSARKVLDVLLKEDKITFRRHGPNTYYRLVS